VSTLFEQDEEATPAFADLVLARFRTQRDGAEADAIFWSERYRKIRARFEAQEGMIEREYWGRNLPLGLVLTEKPRGRINVWLRRPPRMRLHRASLRAQDLPVRVHAAAHDGDMLAVRAAWSLGDLSRHTVLARIFEVQEFLLEVVDASKGRVDPDPYD
jgi:hypothetical protein